MKPKPIREMLRAWPGALLLVVASALGSGAAGVPERHYQATNSWTLEIGSHYESSPALDAAGNIYILTRPGNLLAISPAGKIRWKYHFGFESSSTPAIGTDGTIYFGSRDRHCYAVAATGQLRWTFPTGGWVDASPAIGTDGSIYFGSWDRTFYALDPAGKLRWKFITRGPITSSAAIATNGVIYFGSQDGKLYALRPDGAKQWEFATGGAILSSPAIGLAGTLYFTSTDGHLFAVNPEGTLRWKLHTGGINPASPVLGTNDKIFVGINTNHCAISADGKLLWSMHLSPRGYPVFDWIVASPVALADGTAITAGTDLLLSIYDEHSRWWHTSLGSAIRSNPVITTNGTVYCAASGPELFAFTNFPPPAPSSWPMFRGNAQRTGRVTTAP